MTNQTTALILTSREGSGTGAARAVRREGCIPAVLYGDGKKPEHLKIDIRPIVKGMDAAGFTSKVLDLEVDGKIQKAVVRDIQLDPVTDRPIHVDFMRVSGKSLIHIHVPLEFVNEEKCPGIKRGGVLNIVLHEIEVVCPANTLPDRLTVDLEGLNIGDSLHVDVLNLPKDARVAHLDRDNTLATIVAPTVMKEPQDAQETPASEGTSQP